MKPKVNGFTLIEVLVVMGITAILTGLLVANFSRTRVDLNQTTLAVKAAIREAQSMALSGALSGTPSVSRCGYGIHFTANTYTIYAGPISDATVCTPPNYIFVPDNNVRQGVLSNSVLEIVVPTPDIFFEPPDPKTYIVFDPDNILSSAGKAVTITIRRKGTTACPSADCRQINVTTSGQIQ